MTSNVTSTGSALAVSAGQEFWSSTQLAALKQIGVENASNGDLAVFLNFAQRTGLDPFARQIYMIGRRQKSGDQWTTKWTIQASIDGLRIVAERSGDYAGQVGPEYCGTDGVWRDVWTTPEAPVASRVGVLRTGFSVPLYAVAYYDEYVQTDREGNPTSMWKSKPLLMLAKCAEALALRKAFPNDLAGLYTADEMGQVEHRPAPVEHVAQPVVEVDLETGEVAEPEPETASKAQLGAIAAILKKLDVTDAQERHNVATLIVGRVVESANDLTKAEAHTIIDTLNPLAKSDEPLNHFHAWLAERTAK
jgi:phage recombination protein Bet